MHLSIPLFLCPQQVCQYHFPLRLVLNFYINYRTLELNVSIASLLLFTIFAFPDFRLSYVLSVFICYSFGFFIVELPRSTINFLQNNPFPLDFPSQLATPLIVLNKSYHILVVSFSKFHFHALITLSLKSLKFSFFKFQHVVLTHFFNSSILFNLLVLIFSSTNLYMSHGMTLQSLHVILSTLQLKKDLYGFCLYHFSSK